MRIQWGSLAFIVISLLYCVSAFSPLGGSDKAIGLRQVASALLNKREGDHHHKGDPLPEIDENEVLSYHPPTPPSYYTIDWEDEDHESRHGGLMILHGTLMCLAFFVSLPMGIALRSVGHATYGVAMISFYTLYAIGCMASGLYRKLTPNMYEHAVHRSQGYFMILIAVSLSTLDILSAIRHFITFLTSSDKSFAKFWRIVVKKEEETSVSSSEYANLVENLEEYQTGRESMELQNVGLSVEDHSRQQMKHQRQSPVTSEHKIFGALSPTNHSEETLSYSTWPQSRTKRLGVLSRIGRGLFAVTERSLVVAGFGQLLIGIVTYTGGCRNNYLNGCLAHLIKGGIFWCYGLLTFGRFLGAFADLGWAWNKSPIAGGYSAEFVESMVIFGYGISNTWMERFGAHPGDPYTTKQIQHVSIAVMFWFAGLVGLGVESRVVRKCLLSSIFSSTPPSELSRGWIEEPRSYRASFNPFPALVIGVTGAAMSAHYQTYLFQVQIHALWGNLLVAFAVLRCLTYFFLWLGPPKSILPSRPPTEALGSFFLACGGLVFLFSTEEVTLAAMRRGRDDVMMFLNVAVAITSFAFCWTLCMVAFKGWLKSRIVGTVTYRVAV